MRLKILLSFWLLIAGIQLSAQNNSDSSFRHDEAVLSNLAERLLSVRFNDTLLYRLNNQLQEYFQITLNKKGAFEFPFDSIAPISKVQSEDGDLKIFTWNIKNAQGKFIQFGFIQYYVKSKDEVKLFTLVDKSDEHKEPHNLSLYPENWYGAVYYEMVETKYNGGTLYTLIGWDGNDLFSTKKVIESLVFSQSGRPKFGARVFKFGRERAKRVIYEYSQMANMMIRYDSDLDMIVMDHLSPSKNIHYGDFKMYGPDLSYDALKYDKEFWEYFSDIDYKEKEEKQRFFQKLKTRLTN